MKKFIKKLLKKLKVKSYLNKGYEYFTITNNGVVTDLIFYNPERIYKYDEKTFNY